MQRSVVRPFVCPIGRPQQWRAAAGLLLGALQADLDRHRRTVDRCSSSVYKYMRACFFVFRIVFIISCISVILVMTIIILCISSSSFCHFCLSEC